MTIKNRRRVILFTVGLLSQQRVAGDQDAISWSPESQTAVGMTGDGDDPEAADRVTVVEEPVGLQVLDSHRQAEENPEEQAQGPFEGLARLLAGVRGRVFSSDRHDRCGRLLDGRSATDVVRVGMGQDDVSQLQGRPAGRSGSEEAALRFPAGRCRPGSRRPRLR